MKSFAVICSMILLVVVVEARCKYYRKYRKSIDNNINFFAIFLILFL